ncbi:MAG TPA: hypothetical protein VD859_14590 [Nocardioides sp.]|nr:hypothetical protein [Nocardioides sp.]
MTWTETHRRWQAMREIEEQLARDPGAGLPWKKEYDDLFGDRTGLVAALRYRWELSYTTQQDPTLRKPVRDDYLRRLAARSRGVLRLLDREDPTGEAVPREVA